VWLLLNYKYDIARGVLWRCIAFPLKQDSSAISHTLVDMDCNLRISTQNFGAVTLRALGTNNFAFTGTFVTATKESQLGEDATIETPSSITAVYCTYTCCTVVNIPGPNICRIILIPRPWHDVHVVTSSAFLAPLP
jgi:hypothetical protein